MKNSRRCDNNGAKNGAKKGMETSQNPVSTSKVSTSHDRIDIRIPKSSKTYQFLYVDNNGGRIPKWEQLDNLISITEKARASTAEWIIEDFILRMSNLYPDKRRRLDNLRPLILRRILRNEKLDESYFEILKEL